MCGCFVLALGAFMPRVALALMALFNDEITAAFDGSWLVPFIGWLLLPYTTLAYVLVSWFSGGVEGFTWAFVVLGLVLDLGSYTGGWARRSDVTSYRPPGR
jgi:hypothetical protein